MPLLDRLNNKLKGKKNRLSLPPQSPPHNLGSLPASTSTFNTSVGTASSSWNSNVSLPSNGHVHRHVILNDVPEHPDDFRITAELANEEVHHQQWSPPAQFSPPAPQFSPPPPPQYERFHTHQPGTHHQMQQDEEAAIIASTREKDIVIAQHNELERERNASPETVRRLRELIRQKYALDLYIWSKRGTAKSNRRKIIPKCEEADRLYQEILFIVNAWEENQFSAEEWRMVRRIKTGLLSRQNDKGESNEPAYWMNLKPWERRDDSMRA